jgi:hypothetical protein
VDPAAIDPVLLDFRHPRAAQKAKYGGELFVADSPATPHGARFLDFFQVDKTTGQPKGIVALELGALP